MCHIICHVSIVCHYFVRLGYFFLLTDITQRLTPVRAKRMAILRQNDRCGCNHINDQELTFEYTDYLHLLGDGASRGGRFRHKHPWTGGDYFCSPLDWWRLILFTLGQVEIIFVHPWTGGD